MKNIQIIDGAQNCTFDIFAIPDSKFAVLFPGAGQELESIEDVLAREPDLPEDWWDEIWASPVPKPEVDGIHGTLF